MTSSLTSPTPAISSPAPAFSLCVYCGSRHGADPRYTEAAQAVGTWIGQHGGQLVYGGGRNGLMGVVAQATREAGGRVVGIIPDALIDREQADTLCDELHVVRTMHERKHMMAERADFFVALPGGIGTFEELFEVWTWRQLRYHDKPIGVLNIGGYYDSLLGFLQVSVAQQFMGDWQMGLIEVDTDPDQLLPRLLQAAGHAQPAHLEQL